MIGTYVDYCSAIMAASALTITLSAFGYVFIRKWVYNGSMKWLVAIVLWMGVFVVLIAFPWPENYKYLLHGAGVNVLLTFLVVHILVIADISFKPISVVLIMICGLIWIGYTGYRVGSSEKSTLIYNDKAYQIVFADKDY